MERRFSAYSSIGLSLIAVRALCCGYLLAYADTDQDGKVRVENFEQFLQEQVFILNTHLEGQGEQPVFAMENLMAQVSQPAIQYDDTSGNIQFEVKLARCMRCVV